MFQNDPDKQTAYLWVDGEHAWVALRVIVLVNHTVVVLMPVSWGIRAVVGSSAVDWELLEWAGNLKRLIDNLQRDAKDTKKKAGV